MIRLFPSRPNGRWPVEYICLLGFAVISSIIYLGTTFSGEDYFTHVANAIKGDSKNADASSAQHKEDLVLAAAGNRTLGFSKIYFINLPNRYDRMDAGVLQAYLSGIDITLFPAVNGKTIEDTGMPPTSSNSPTGVEKGCWRAHANIWSEMLEKRLDPILIMEADAGWDLNIRQIMPLFNKNFRRLLQKINSKPLHHFPHADDGHTEDSNHTLEADPNDPWHQEHWDMISIGQCFEDGMWSDISVRYHDPWSPDGHNYWGVDLKDERVVRRSGGVTCTTAYAVSRSGAAKLLVRTMLDLDQPVDLIMKDMIQDGSMLVYSVQPTIIAQWEYVRGIGMEARHGNSDIRKRGSEEEEKAKKEKEEAWRKVEETKSVWVSKPGHPDAGFKYMALQHAWESVYGQVITTRDGLTSMPGHVANLTTLLNEEPRG